MALLRMTDKKLAANRANAHLSHGPITAAGKEKVSRNACRHHLYARTHLLHPAWEARIWDVINPAAACIENPAERARLVDYFFLKLWRLELYSFETRLMNQSIARHRSVNRGTHAYVTTHPLVHPIQNRCHMLARHAERARKAWEREKRDSAGCRSIPQILQIKTVTPTPETLTFAAAAGSGVPSVKTATSCIFQLVKRLVGTTLESAAITWQHLALQFLPPAGAARGLSQLEPSDFRHPHPLKPLSY